MIKHATDILVLHPIRKSQKQKKSFRESVCSYLQEMGYECVVEKGSYGSRNVVIGDPENAKYLITAHYDTGVWMPLPKIVAPCNFWVFLGYHLLLTIMLFLPAAMVALVAGLISSDVGIANIWFLLTLMISVLLMTYGPATRYNANQSSGVLTLLEIAKTLPPAYRDRVCFVLFDLKEAGMLGSAAYAATYKKEIKSQLVWNLDCVGSGDEIVMFPSGKTIKDEHKMALLHKCETSLATKRIYVCQNGFRYYVSDHVNFPCNVGISAFKREKIGLYHLLSDKKNDTLDETNVNILRAAIISAITCDGVR